jgi:hypothetical protein
MESIDIMALSRMNATELGKLSKAQLVEAICKNSYLPGHYKSRTEDLENKIRKQQDDCKAACVVLAAFVGHPLPKNEYSHEIEADKLNILELAGLVCQKAAAGRLA